MKNSKIVSISKLPGAGLGNKLFSWASGVIFSSINECVHYTIGMTRIHLGPILRNEKSKRFYFGYFKNEILFLPFWLYLRTFYHKNQKECNTLALTNGNFVFSEIPHWSDSFEVIRDYRNLIIEAFWSSLTAKVKNRIATYPSPIISLHIRMGDFRVLKEGENFAEVGLVRTPFSYFVSVINMIRSVVGKNLPITLFSDGSDDELKEVYSIPNLTRINDDIDIVHLAVLSRSKILIMSAGSTFSHWAGFLSDSILINHFQHIHAPIRPHQINRNIYEGPLMPGDLIQNYPLLLQNLLKLKEEFDQNRA
jgi:hypothetical protein